MKNYCLFCDYTTSNTKDFKRHLMTAKHKIQQNTTKIQQKYTKKHQKTPEIPYQRPQTPYPRHEETRRQGPLKRSWSPRDHPDAT